MGTVERLWTDWMFANAVDDIRLRRLHEQADAARKAFHKASGDEKLDAMIARTQAVQVVRDAEAESRATDEHFGRALNQILDNTGNRCTD